MFWNKNKVKEKSQSDKDMDTILGIFEFINQSCKVLEEVNKTIQKANTTLRTKVMTNVIQTGIHIDTIAIRSSNIIKNLRAIKAKTINNDKDIIDANNFKLI